MSRFFLKRLLASVPVIFGVCTLTFFLIHLVPGDPVLMMLGEYASFEDQQALRAQLNLHLPLLDQYLSFLTKLSRGDLGLSFHANQEVSALIRSRFPATFELASVAMMMAIFFGLPIGVWSAVKKSSWSDTLIQSFSLFGMSVPGIFLGPLLIWVFAIRLNWLPVSDRSDWTSVILPAVSLAIPLGAVLTRLTRASMLEVINEDYMRVARSKGISSKTLFFHHALRNALIPIITIVGLQIGALLTGTVITETIFDWPGIGTLLLTSIQRRDYPVIQGCILLIALIYVTVNCFTDLAYGLAHPKIRAEGKGE